MYHVVEVAKPHAERRAVFDADGPEAWVDASVAKRRQAIAGREQQDHREGGKDISGR